ncbi:sulfite exporter TauE/SafE family protein [Beggiatoa leptomitoformis]|uniref:Sulfite exporter TauE/SafE family protein n=1 Tax=Beggiatoa leptomitoformis TaxID=288004 RepID=A0A2N9YAD2_9GAMM|nr:sulfite exporter TauE/SafE family protein [Beggiatoa leptomitoformis]ALG67185.1 sulfite exporter TauE/SafE family protein [Beggiatoa leptomitoformis]AUI67411.1 sulfite exporter TauE/SafE family protein [Beggiatoa leptomitoformis]
MLELYGLSAFLTGLLGSVHCVGMCGGIVGALTMGLPATTHQSPLRLFPYLLTYNLGRLSSYMLSGALVGFLGGQFTEILPQPHLIGMAISGIFMIILGLYLGGWWQFLSLLEKQGAKLWRKIQPFSRYFLPVKNPLQALGLGIIWGWLPCGLVYTALMIALASGSAWEGSLLMLAFGLGTLPMLLTMGATTAWLNRLTRHIAVRRGIGLLVIIFGVYTLSGFAHPIRYGIHGTNMCYYNE